MTNYFFIIAQYSDPGNVFKNLPLLTITIYRVKKKHSSTRFAYFCLCIEFLKAYGHQTLARIYLTGVEECETDVCGCAAECIERALQEDDCGHADELHLGSTEGR